MPQQVTTAVENNFTKGLVTEATGLNFPENAATETDNCTYTLIGDVTRRGGITTEANHSSTNIARNDQAVSSYKWNNAGGGFAQIVVEQIGRTILFYKSNSATTSTPLSAQLLDSRVTISDFATPGNGFDGSKECQYADGNGYLFIYHPSCDPIYCTYSNDVITGNRITVQIRDFAGVPDGLAPNVRPTSLSVEHNYNLINQGWVAGNPWSTTSSTSVLIGLGPRTFIVSAGLPVTLGDEVTILLTHGVGTPMMSGNVTSYSGTTMVINVTSGATSWFGTTSDNWSIIPRNTAYISSWFTSIGNYPSNSDVWWYFKNASGGFDPGATLGNTSIGAGNGPRGHFILDAFSQQRDLVSGLAITDIQTAVRPRTGAWFQGRVWYTGVDAQQPPVGNVNAYSWSENIYFSQVVNNVDDFGRCYQNNDPTSENLFDLLPTDGGVITIQGCGNIYKLFPIQNGMLVFAANGVWFITGSQGIGFSASDYTITKISSVRSISSSSFVDVLGLPYFWNEEGIYAVQNQQQGGLAVVSQTYSTIDTFYHDIPMSSKKYARGDYDPINYVIQWVYRDTEADSTTAKYQFNKILNYNTANKAFFPYTVVDEQTGFNINGITYVTYPGGGTSPEPSFKYFSSNSNQVTFAEERDFDTYIDWDHTDYTSYFVTGYKIRGQGIRKFQPQYIQMWLRSDGSPISYKIQGLWDYAINRNSGRWSSIQAVDLMGTDRYSMVHKRHKIRGHGYALQFKITSQAGKSFDIAGWAVVDTVNAGT